MAGNSLSWQNRRMADEVPRVAVLAVVAAALAWAVGAIVAVDPGADPPTTYAAAFAAARVADLVAGLAMVLAGALACTQPRVRRLGLLVLLAGFAWFGPDWEGAADAPAALRSLGAVVAPFSLVLVLHLGLALPRGRLRSPAARTAVMAAYATAAVVSAGTALLRDPLLDLYCWRNCSDNVFLVHADPGSASALGNLRLWSVLAMALGLIALAAYRLLTATRPARRLEAPLLIPAALVGAAEGIYALGLLLTPLEEPQRGGFAVIFIARSLAFTALSLGLAWSIVRLARTRARVVRLSGELGEAPPPGRFREALAAALEDPGIEVFYPRPGSSRLIDADGLPARPPEGGRSVARITRRGRELALVVHDAALVDERELERALGSAARLALENEALRAEVLAQLARPARSRARASSKRATPNAAGSSAISTTARSSGCSRSPTTCGSRGPAPLSDGDGALAALLDAAGDETETALDELRELAHGIYPAILSEAGLGPALRTLADEAPVPVELGDVEAAGSYRRRRDHGVRRRRRAPSRTRTGGARASSR